MAKKIKSFNHIVYSTDPQFSPDQMNEPELENLSPAEQLIKVRLETKHRAGKAVTLIENFTGSTKEKEELGKKLKTFCGTGGSVKDGEILIQGDNRSKALQWLHKNGFTKARII